MPVQAETLSERFDKFIKLKNIIEEDLIRWTTNIPTVYTHHQCYAFWENTQSWIASPYLDWSGQSTQWIQNIESTEYDDQQYDFLADVNGLNIEIAALDTYLAPLAIANDENPVTTPEDTQIRLLMNNILATYTPTT